MNLFESSLGVARLVDQDEESPDYLVDEWSGSIHPQVADGRDRRLSLVALGGVASGVLVVLALVGTTTGRTAVPARSAGVREGKGVVELSGMFDLVTFASGGAATAAKIVEDGKGDFEANVFPQISKPAHEAALAIPKEAPAENPTEPIAHLHDEQLYPTNNVNDDNQCPDTEELFGGLCYTKCSVLTRGQYSIRTTAFACCSKEPCSFFNSKFSNPLKYCSGLDVAGHVDHTSCPHQPGDCLANEEFNLGLCYKKCSLLTNNEYPYRFGAQTCCKYRSHLACLNPRNVVTKAELNCGGGRGDNLLAATAAASHTPIPALAEVQTTTTQPGTLTAVAAVM